MQFFVDSDSAADWCEQDIWLMGVKHPGHRSAETESLSETSLAEQGDRSAVNARGKGRRRTLSPQLQDESGLNVNGWPSLFFHDFYSRIALTYRTGFPPIPCSSPGAVGSNGMLNAISMTLNRSARTADGLTSDTGWGCMLRTGQSMLANAMVAVHLGRDWRRPLPGTSAANVVPDAAKYSRIVSMFIDDPSAPFSVHRFAAMGESLGKAVGQWFGPSTASGAIKALANEHGPSGLKVVNAVDGTIFASDVADAARGDEPAWTSPVLVLIGLRLGIDGVNPIYHDAVKGIFQFPQSVGIAGGRPSSSYYFVGSQEDSLFYVDPHHPRPAVSLRALPEQLRTAELRVPLSARPSTASLDTDAQPTHGVASDYTVDSFPQVRAQLDSFYAGAYSDSDLSSFHCDKVRKMPLSALDPSMLVGFLINDERDWDDFCARVRRLSIETKPIFSVAPSPPSWMRRPSASPATVRPRSATMLSQSPSASATGELPSSPPVMVNEAEAEFYSEPEEWELDSTDASGDELEEDGESVERL
ncbi:hypothetical protein ACM66B_000298 [Microbotryomycetes sp. NB124-2]